MSSEVRPSISGNNFWEIWSREENRQDPAVIGRVIVFVESRLSRDLSLNVDEGSFFIIILDDFEKLFLGSTFALQFFRIFLDIYMKKSILSDY